MEKIFTLLRGKQLMFFIMTALLMGAVETAKADYSVTGPEILSGSEWTKETGRWNEYQGGIYDYAGGNYLSNTELVSPLITATKGGQRVVVNGYNNGGSNSVFCVYFSTDKTNWTLGKDLSDAMNATTGSAVDMVAEFEVEDNYYVKLVCNKVFIINLKVEEYDVVYTPEMTVYSNATGTVATNNQTEDFGLVDEAPTYTYYVKNTDRGTLTVDFDVTGECTVSPESLSLTAGQQQAVTITPSANATVTMKGLNGDELLSTFTVNFKGEVMDKEGKFFEDFNGTSLAPVQASDLPGWDVDVTEHDGAEGYAGRIQFFDDNGTTVLFYYVTSNADTPAYLITPKLRVKDADDTMYFRCNGLSAQNYTGHITISYSTDKNQWTTIEQQYNTSSYVQYSFKGIPEGDYYIKFELWDATLDWVYGFVLAPETESLALDENVAPEALTTGTQDVVLNYTAKAGWNTIALPFSVSDLSVFGTGAKAYELKGYQEGALKFSPATTLEAGKPYVLYVETPAEANGNYSFEAVDITATEPAAMKFNGAKFVSTYAPMAAGTMAGKYGVVPTTGKIQKGSANASLKGFRAYFTLPDNAANARIVIDGEEVTSISAIDAIGQDNAPVYDLSGRKVSVSSISSVSSVLPKGIYIVNGKKMVVK